MKLSSLFASAAIAMTAFGAQAHDVVYNLTLNGANESPANASAGTGSAIITLNDHDFTLRVQTTFSGLTGTVTAAHIHCCTAVADTGTAGVATATPSFPGFPSGVTAGSYDQLFDMTLSSSWNAAFISANGGTTGSAFSVLATGLAAGKAYLNIHTTSVAAGEIRDFSSVAAVPEPETYALMLAGLGLLGAVAKRRRQPAAA